MNTGDTEGTQDVVATMILALPAVVSLCRQRLVTHPDDVKFADVTVVAFTVVYVGLAVSATVGLFPDALGVTTMLLPAVMPVRVPEAPGNTI